MGTGDSCIDFISYCNFNLLARSPGTGHQASVPLIILYKIAWRLGLWNCPALLKGGVIRQKLRMQPKRQLIHPACSGEPGSLRPAENQAVTSTESKVSLTREFGSLVKLEPSDNTRPRGGSQVLP